MLLSSNRFLSSKQRLSLNKHSLQLQLRSRSRSQQEEEEALRLRLNRRRDNLLCSNRNSQRLSLLYSSKSLSSNRQTVRQAQSVICCFVYSE